VGQSLGIVSGDFEDFPGEIQDLYPKLINSETTASFFSRPSKDL
jgi:hypothetical protein